MITIKNIWWSNWFSYGEDNFISLDSDKVTQIIGRNGTGKSSIPVIIGEVLYGKNALSKTKQQIFNRYLEKPVLSADIEFEIDNDTYEVRFSRKATVKLLLLKNGTDISSHSSTNTYKTLQNLLGYDFKTFWGLIYQSSKEGLEFLTATDTNRKKFLINLFNLEQYIKIHDIFKKITSDKDTELKVLKGKLETINAWIKKHSEIDLTKLPIDKIPEINKDLIDKLTDLKTELSNIKDTNKKINDNEQYKLLLNNLDASILSETIVEAEDIEKLQLEISELNKLTTEKSTLISIYTNDINKVEKLPNKCPTCEQAIDIEFIESYIRGKKYLIDRESSNITEINNKLDAVMNRKTTAIYLMNKHSEQKRVGNELQSLLNKIDKELPNEIVIEEDIQKSINDITNTLRETETSIKIISDRNSKNEAHNAKVNVIKEQLEDYKNQLAEIHNQTLEDQKLVDNLEIIKKAFSTNGLVSYKIENLSKDLENQINTYLEELSKGRFQLQFTIVGDKLNVDIIDDGLTIGIEELSAGELARVNTATLLAIRKLMAAISSTKINILFLDEITGVLDEEGKEVLIDILTNETELNTFLVSHEYSHPLVPQIVVVKEDKISKIEE
jgi:DNA repair exonuclease SbcCD ATPase subunit